MQLIVVFISWSITDLLIILLTIDDLITDKSTVSIHITNYQQNHQMCDMVVHGSSYMIINTHVFIHTCIHICKYLCPISMINSKNLYKWQTYRITLINIQLLYPSRKPSHIMYYDGHYSYKLGYNFHPFWAIRLHGSLTHDNDKDSRHREKQHLMIIEYWVFQYTIRVGDVVIWCFMMGIIPISSVTISIHSRQFTSIVLQPMPTMTSILDTEKKNSLTYSTWSISTHYQS